MACRYRYRMRSTCRSLVRLQQYPSAPTNYSPGRRKKKQSPAGSSRMQEFHKKFATKKKSLIRMRQLNSSSKLQGTNIQLLFSKELCVSSSCNDVCAQFRFSPTHVQSSRRRGKENCAHRYTYMQANSRRKIAIKISSIKNINMCTVSRWP
jgi:hypothetical protein